MTAFTDLRPQQVAPGPPILLVDDEQAILDGLRRQLRKKFTVHTAAGGEEVRGRGNGWDYVHVAVDDHSRLA